MRSSKSRTTERGFSLLELLVVVFIIGVIAAIAIPNLLSSKRAANGASAVSALRLIHSAEVSYHAVYSQYGSLSSLASSGQLTDPQLAAGQHSQYTFNVNPATLSASAFEVTAAHNDETGLNYYVDASGVIRFENGAPATAASQPIN